MGFPITFIDETDVFELTNQSINVDPKWVRPGIRPAQDINLKCHLGHLFYDYLIDAIENSTETADDLLLLSQLSLKYCLVFFTLAEIANTYTDRRENQGNVFNVDASYTRSESNQISLNKTEAISRAQFYLNEFLKWLIAYDKANPNAFPLFHTFISETNCACDNQGKCDVFNDGIYYYKNKLSRRNYDYFGRGFRRFIQ
jgi:hypothetical protein